MPCFRAPLHYGRIDWGTGTIQGQSTSSEKRVNAPEGREPVEPEPLTRPVVSPAPSGIERPSERELNAISALVNWMVGSHAVLEDTLTVNLRDPQVQAGLKKHGWTQEEIDLRIEEGFTPINVASSMSPVLVSPGQWKAMIQVAIGVGVALPFLDDLLDLWEKLFATPVRSNMRKTLREFGGPVMETLGMAGIPALMGIDISGSLKTGIPFTSLVGGQGTPADTVYGVYASMGRKAVNAMNAAERQDYLRALEFASPSFIEAVLKAYRMADWGATTPRGKVLTDEDGKPIRLGTGEAIAQAAGFRPERLARIAGEHWTMENVKSNFKDLRDDLYARYRLAKTQEERQKVIRFMQRFNMDARRYLGVIPPITATSLKQSALPKPEKAFLAFGRMMEASL
jgi:hypothetical protein